MQVQALGGTEQYTDRSQRTHQQAHDFYNTACPDRCDIASRRAAKMLITPAAFLDAARNESRAEVIADHLLVTEGDVWAYISGLNPDDWLRMQRLVGHGIS